MIEALRNNDLVKKFGGRFKMTALIQHRMHELMEGATPLVEVDGKSLLETVIQEMEEGKIDLDYQTPDSPKTEKLAPLKKAADKKRL